VNAVRQGELIESSHSKDKEYHFQDWFKKRLETENIFFNVLGRNKYPDFVLTQFRVGFEVKGLAWPGRERDYDCNSQVPSGFHNGQEIFYVFGRYPADRSEHHATDNGRIKYPVIDLVI